jgi:hypothetical protein
VRESIAPVELPKPARGAREHTFKVSHEGLGTTVQGIDDHSAVGGTRDFDPAVFQAGRGWRAHPGGISADVGGLRRKIKLFSRVKTLLDGMAGVEELQTRETTSDLREAWTEVDRDTPRASSRRMSCAEQRGKRVQAR